MTPTPRRATLALALAAFAAACATAPATRTPAATPPPAATADMDAVLWVATSAEYRAAALQAFAAAGEAMERALADSTWTAALEQTGEFAGLPPAVIVDADETVLDNTPAEATMIVEHDGVFDTGAWAEWVESGEAGPVPGALEFARRAERLGVTVFYVTNRDAPLEPGTRRSLERAGFPVAGERDVVLLRGEREGWTGDKSSRRAHVAASFRVLIVVGDDLNDFVAAPVAGEEREALARRHAERWGTRWFVIPNPMYGGWESALWDGRSGLSEAERIEAKRERLDAIAF